MDTALLLQGLDCFANGDLRGAAKAWLELQRREPQHRQVQAYLQHLRTQAPGVIEQVERESHSRNTPIPIPQPALPDLSAIAVPVAQPTLAAAPMSLPHGPWAEPANLGPSIEVKTEKAGLHLTSDTTPKSEPEKLSVNEQLAQQMRELARLDDFTSVLQIAEKILETDPGNMEALAAKKKCRGQLEQMYFSRLRNMENIPHLLTPPEQIIWLDLDHRAGFVLAQIDGVSSYNDILELTGMDRLESLRILAQLVQKKIIGAN